MTSVTSLVSQFIPQIEKSFYQSMVASGSYLGYVKRDILSLHAVVPENSLSSLSPQSVISRALIWIVL